MPEPGGPGEAGAGGSAPWPVSSRKKRDLPSGEGAGEKAPPVTLVRVTLPAPSAGRETRFQMPEASVAP